MTDPTPDHDLARLLRGAADEAPLPSHDLVTRSARRGAVRRRVRIGTGLAAAVAVVAAGSGAVLALSSGAETPTLQVAADPSPTTTPNAPSASDQPSTTPAWTPPPRGDRSDLAVFADVVGEASQGVGVLSDAASYPYGFRGIRSVSAVLTDDVGPARVQVAVTTQDPTVGDVGPVTDGTESTEDCVQPALDNLPAALGCLSFVEVGGLRCGYPAPRGWQCRELADGGVLRWGVERTYTDERDQGEYSNSATLTRGDGLVVNVYAFNGPGEKEGVSRATPPLDLDAVKQIALDPRWADVDLAG